MLSKFGAVCFQEKETESEKNIRLSSSDWLCDISGPRINKIQRRKTHEQAKQTWLV